MASPQSAASVLSLSHNQGQPALLCSQKHRVRCLQRLQRSAASQASMLRQLFCIFN